MEAEVRQRRVGRNLELRYSGHVLPGFPREVGASYESTSIVLTSFRNPNSIPSPCGFVSWHL